MASFWLDALDRFPAGTSVQAFPDTGWNPTMLGAAGPPVVSVETQVMADSGATFTALARGKRYWFGAQISGEWRFVEGGIPTDEVATPPYIDVKYDFQALGNGVDDDTARIQAAIDYAGSLGGGLIFFPAGDYVVNGGLVIPEEKQIRLLGSGMGMGGGSTPMGLTRLKRTSGTTTIITAAGSSFLSRARVAIENMEIHGGGTAGIGIALDRGNNCYLHRVRVIACAHNAIRLRQVFNSALDNIFIHNSGSSTQGPMLFGYFAEASGACNTIHIDHIEFESNAGPDIVLDGWYQDINSFSAATAIQFTAVKMEGGTGEFPYIDLRFAQDCKFLGLQIFTAGRNTTPVQENRKLSGSTANQFQAVTFEFTGPGVPPYAAQLSLGSQQWENVNLVLSGAVTAGFRIESTVAAGYFQLSNVLSNATGIPTVSDARTAIPSVNSAATITLPGHNPLVSVAGTTNVTSITAEETGREVTLIFPNVLTLVDGGNLKLAGDFTTSLNDAIRLVCAAGDWYEVARSVN